MAVNSIFSDLCNCCFDLGNIDISRRNVENFTFGELLRKYSSLPILSRKICQTCSDELIACHSFFEKVAKTNQEFLKILEENKLNNSKESNDVSSIQSCKFDDAISTHSIKLEDDNTINLNELDFNSTNTNELEDSVKIENSYSEIENALSLCQSNNERFVCEECNARFKYYKWLVRHCREMSHPMPRRFQCEICSVKYIRKSQLQMHMNTHTGERPYKCKECDMRFISSQNLKRHNLRHTGERPFSCDVCGRGFIQKHAMIEHMRIHNGETPYSCQICGKKYRAKSVLTNHLHMHHGSESHKKKYAKYQNEKVECTICKRQLMKFSLYTHMKNRHGDGFRKFLCNLCGKTYKTKYSLEIHMNVHKKIKEKNTKYYCKICSKSFEQSCYMKLHMRIHSGEKPYCCDICGKTFTQHAHLKTHMKTHTGDKPHVCTFCNKSFALNGNLRVHVRIHTGETPYKCSICEKGFKDSSTRSKHERSVHNERIRKK